MPGMTVNVEGGGGAFSDVLNRCEIIEALHDSPIRVETLDRGMKSGAPSVAFLIELPGDRVVFAQTSVKLFEMAAALMLGKYGDQTEGGMMGRFKEGSFSVTMSSIAKCRGCEKDIPGSCRYCPECGFPQFVGDEE